MRSIECVRTIARAHISPTSPLVRAETLQEGWGSSVVPTGSTDVLLPLRLYLNDRCTAICSAPPRDEREHPSVLSSTRRSQPAHCHGWRSTGLKQDSRTRQPRHQVTRSFKFADPGSNRPITVLPNTTVSVRRSCRVCQVASPRNQLYSSDQEVARIWRPLAVSTHTCDDFEDQRVARACWHRHLLISRTRCRAEPACPRNRAARSCRSDRSPDVCCLDRGSDRRWTEHRWRDRN